VWGQQWEPYAKQLHWDGSTVYGTDFAKVCASAKIVIDIKTRVWDESIGQSSSNRLVRQLACGGFSLSRGTRESKAMFREGEHCAWYDSEAEAFDKIAYYLAHDETRRAIATRGTELVQAHHMLDNRVPNLLTGAPYQNPLESA
jgi:spore maturation protein CgeB